MDDHSTNQSLLRRAFRIVAVVLLVGVGVALFLVPEPFTSALGIVLVLVALAWSGWSVLRNRSESSPQTRS